MDCETRFIERDKVQSMIQIHLVDERQKRIGMIQRTMDDLPVHGHVLTIGAGRRARCTTDVQRSGGGIATDGVSSMRTDPKFFIVVSPID